MAPNTGATTSYASALSKGNTGGSYRNYLQSLANQGGLAGQEASALLQVVGDDGRINDHFLSNPYEYTGTDRGQVFSNIYGEGQNTGYGPQGVTRLNDIFLSNYNSMVGDSGNTLGSSTFSSSGASGPEIDPAQIAQYEQAIGLTQNALSRLPGQLKVARANVGDQYQIGVNELDSSRSQAQNNYNTQTTQNSQNYRTDKNLIADQASQGLRGLQRILGALGAGGSSEALFVAPQAVADVATQQRSGAGQTYSSNQQAMDTNWGNYQTQDENERKKLGDWKTRQINEAESQSTQNRQDLLLKLADLQGSLSAYRGGSYAGSAQPFVDQARTLNSRVDELARFKPTYTGQTPVYQAASLDSYNATANAPQAQTNALQGTNSPYLAMLLGQREDERQRVR